MRSIYAYCLILLLAALPTPTLADLSYIPVPSGNSIVLKISGKIEHTDNPQKLIEAIDAYHPVMIAFDSPGGSPIVAMQLGRIIRAMGLDTLQLRAFECASACAFAFMGGVQRFAEPGSIGVHRNSFTDDYGGDRQQAASDVQEVTAELIAYFKEMGVDPVILSVAYRYGKDDIRYLSGSEMAEMGVTTSNSTNPANETSANQTAAAPVVTKNQDMLVGAGAVNVSMPIVNSVVIRHPKGAVSILAEPIDDASPVRQVPNGSVLPVLFATGKWYKVRLDSEYGYVHKTWVYPEQFSLPLSDQKFVQISSFADFAAARDFVQGFGLPAEIYFTSDNWFAVTLAGSTPSEEAKERLKQFKAAGSIPEDAFVTYGNTYIRLVCCK